MSYLFFNKKIPISFSKYNYRRYFDDERGCLNCSCCGDGNNTVEEECKRKLGAGSNMICSFNRSATGCEFITPSPQTVTTIIQDDTSKQNERINDSESTPSPETGVGITRDEFSKQPTSIYYQLEIRQIIDYKPSIIESVSISSLVLLGIVVATLVVATLVFLFRRGSMQRYCMRRMNTARDLDEDDGIPMEPIGMVTHFVFMMKGLNRTVRLEDPLVI